MAPRKKTTKKAAAASSTSTAQPSAKVTKKAEGPPKRPPSAYQMWFAENRDTIRAQSRIKNLLKAGHVVWKKLEDKSEWEQRAKAEMDRFKRERAEYTGDAGATDAADGDAENEEQ